MAGKIRGITIELGGDTSGLTKSLQNANKEIKNTQKQLSDVERLLKLDPTNTELLRQKQELLGKAIGETEGKLEELKKAEETMKAQGIDENSEQFMALQREIIATENELKNLTTEANNTKSAFDGIQEVTTKVAEGAGLVAEKTAALSGAGAALAGGLLATGAAAIKTADDLATLSAQTGLSTDTLQKFQFAQDMVDVSTETLTGAMSKMKRQMDENPEAFEALGVSVTDADGNFRNLEDVFYEVLESLSEIEGSTERDLAAMDIFGKGADSLATIIDDGGASLKAYGEKAEEMGLILSTDTINSLSETGDQVDTMKAQATMMISQVGAELLKNLAPAIETIIGKISSVIEWIGTLDSDTLETILIVAGVVAAISPVAKMVQGISTAIGGLTKVLQFLIANPMVALVAAIVALVVLIATKGDEIQKILNKVDSFLKNIFTKDWTKQFGVLGNGLNAFFAIVKGVWDSIKKIFDGIINFIRGVFTGDWSRAWEGVKQIFSGAFNALVTIAKAPLNLIIGVINGLIDGINWCISGLNSIRVNIPDWVPVLGGKTFGLNLGYLSRIAYLAQGGILQAGSAMVGENGPELLTMTGQGAVVQPLTNNTANHNYGGITLNVYGAAGQNVQELAEIIMDEIGDATRRQEAAFA